MIHTKADLSIEKGQEDARTFMKYGKKIIKLDFHT